MMSNELSNQASAQTGTPSQRAHHSVIFVGGG